MFIYIMSKCAPNVLNGTAVRSGVNWCQMVSIVVDLIHCPAVERSLMVTCFSKLLFHNRVFY